MPHRNPDHPAISAPPPFIFLFSIVVGWLLNWVIPLPLLYPLWGWIVGLMFMAVGLLLGFSALFAMRRSGTPVDPYETPTALVVDGPYRFTRNPIYLGFTFITLGLVCLINSLWLVLLLPLTLIVVDRGVIAREEIYLERKFGEAYTSYKARVRRWI